MNTRLASIRLRVELFLEQLCGPTEVDARELLELEERVMMKVIGLREHRDLLRDLLYEALRDEPGWRSRAQEAIRCLKLVREEL